MINKEKHITRKRYTLYFLNKVQDSLKRLSKQVSDLLLTVDLTKLLPEINLHTGFTEEFFHAN
ncbi:hypothetical protein DQY68_26415 [Salmonella enterica subsp. salamae]|nr:hypothetical protein [Salmonella enterica subsp. salamae]